MMPAATWLFASAAGLAGGLAMELAITPATALPPLAHPSRAPATQTAPPQAVALPIAALLARPPFDPSRRPGLSRTPDTPPGTRLDLPRLTAIVVGAHDRRAIFATPGPHAAVVAEGDEIGAYRVQAITPDVVRLAGPDGVFSVQPRFSNAPVVNVVAMPFVSLPPPPPRVLDPARFFAPVGPLGIAAYRHSPAAPPEAPLPVTSSLLEFGQAP